MRNALLAMGATLCLVFAAMPAEAAPMGSLAAGKAAAGSSDVIQVGHRWRGNRYYGRPERGYYRPGPYLVARNYGWITRSYGTYPPPAVYYNAPVYYGPPGVLYTPVVRYYAPPPVVVYAPPAYYDGYRDRRGIYARW